MPFGFPASRATSTSNTSKRPSPSYTPTSKATTSTSIPTPPSRTRPATGSTPPTSSNLSKPTQASLSRAKALAQPSAPSPSSTPTGPSPKASKLPKAPASRIPSGSSVPKLAGRRTSAAAQPSDSIRHSAKIPDSVVPSPNESDPPSDSPRPKNTRTTSILRRFRSPQAKEPKETGLLYRLTNHSSSIALVTLPVEASSLPELPTSQPPAPRSSPPPTSRKYSIVEGLKAEAHRKGMHRTWSMELPNDTKKIGAQGVSILSAETSSIATRGSPAPTTPVEERVVESQIPTVRTRAPRIAASFGTRAGAGTPSFLNGIPRASSSSKPLPTPADLQSIPSPSAPISEFASRRNSTLFPSMLSPTLLAAPRRKSDIHVTSSASHTPRASPEVFSAPLPPRAPSPTPSVSSSIRPTMIRTNSSKGSIVSVSSRSSRDSILPPPSSTTSYLRFSDIFPAPPDTIPVVQTTPKASDTVPKKTVSSYSSLASDDSVDSLLETPQRSTFVEDKQILTPSLMKEGEEQEEEVAVVKEEEIKTAKEEVPSIKEDIVDLGGGLFVTVNCVKHGSKGMGDEDSEDEEIKWEITIRKKAPSRPASSINPYFDKPIQSPLSSSFRPSLSTRTSLSSPYPVLTPQDLLSISPLNPTEAISPSTNNTLSLSLSLSPSTFTTTSGRLTFLPIPSLAPPSPAPTSPKQTKMSQSLQQQQQQPIPFPPLAPFNMLLNRSSFKRTHSRSNSEAVIGTPPAPANLAGSVFGEDGKGSPVRRHARTASVGEKGLSASPKHYSLKDLAEDL